jgi:hypothetical protein
LFAGKLRLLLYYHRLFFVDLRDGSFEQFVADFLMGQLPSPVKSRQFYAVAFSQEIFGPAQFYFQIVLTDLQPEPDLLYVDGFVFALSFLLLFGFLVDVLSPVQYAADRRIGIRRHFHEIETGLFGPGQGVSDAQNTQLRTICIYKPDARSANGSIDASGLFYLCLLRKSFVTLVSILTKKLLGVNGSVAGAGLLSAA